MKKQSIDDFIDRLTQHIPDKFFKMIRYYGFLSYRTRTIILPKIYDLVGQTIEAYQQVTFTSLMKVISTTTLAASHGVLSTG
nr:transposase [Piscirickettsia salmonis]